MASWKRSDFFALETLVSESTRTSDPALSAAPFPPCENRDGWAADLVWRRESGPCGLADALGLVITRSLRPLVKARAFGMTARDRGGKTAGGGINCPTQAKIGLEWGTRRGIETFTGTSTSPLLPRRARQKWGTPDVFGLEWGARHYVHSN